MQMSARFLRSTTGPALALLAGLLTACSTDAPATPVAQPPSVAAPRTITVYPVLLAEHPSRDVAEVVALMLERAGLQRIEVPAEPFTAPTGGYDEAAFAAHVAAQPPDTDCALLAQYDMTPEGVRAVHGVLVDTQGHVLWRDQQTPADAAFQQTAPRNPMTCCVLLLERLRGPLAYRGDPFAGTGDGPWSRHWETKSALPPDAERTAIEKRARLAARRHDARLVVLPPRIPTPDGDQWSAECAERIAQAIDAAGLFHATTATAPLHYAVEPASNEMLMLWTGARAVQAAVRESPLADADFVLASDFLFSPVDGTVHAVHSWLCDATGQWVVVDMQNEYHDDFQRAAPRSREDCSDLVVTRLRERLAE
ncbi:MAG: hypothetical protein IPM29_06755 [Planctomycetes bacterium]|nr:hypothetical protein [Planctomycetota bacterium]